MNYEKKYNEALKRASNLYKDAVEMENNMTTKTCEIIFPELKDSEDERIRKELIQYLKECTNLPSGQYCRADFFDWLEKQGEQKSITIDIDKMVYEFAHTEVKGYGMPAMIEVDAYRKGVNDALCLSVNIEKQGEHKPFDYENANIQQKDFAPKVEPKFKVGDTVRFKGNETLKGEAETHKIVGYDNELYVFADGTTDLFCEQELYELVEQKSIAWSEEDEDMLQSILDEYKSMTTEKRNWLKSLKEKVQPQFTWRPSEHELEVLKLVAEKDGTCLMGLYKQLKKLKEE